VGAVNQIANADRTVLAADVGATKTTIGVISGPPWNVTAATPLRAENARYRSFEDLLVWALDAAGRPRIDVACIAAAGPVLGQTISMTNLAWRLDAEAVARVSGAPRARLLNDLEATALGALVVSPDEIRVLQRGAPPEHGGHVVTIAPGTGLGEAILCWDGTVHHPVASEGGHVDFAPRGELQTKLLGWLAARHGHVSYERILSGPGIVAVYEFLRETGVAAEAPALRTALAAADPAAVISRAALDQNDPLCEATLDVFVRVLGAKAGNLALEAVAFGGVFVAGGVTAHLAPALADGRFLEAFRDKGRHRTLLERMPVSLVLEPNAAWLGAAAFGVRLAQ
jgi:glucokinase